MKKTLVFIIVLCACLKSNAQVVVTGRIVDSTKTGLEFATVALLNPLDSAILQTTLTDQKGNYTITYSEKGNFLLKLFSVGYTPAYSPIAVNSDRTEVPDIILKTGIDLSEVTVSTLKKLIEYKNGNITVNVEDSPLAQGNSVFDLLSRLPGVTVDENNTISIQGKSGVKIMIDDRVQQLSGQQLINLLKSLNASNIEKIEVLKNPPIKYDASGIGGMINIKTKKVKLTGFSGSVNLNYSQGFYDHDNADVSLNYRGKKIIFYSTITADKTTMYHDHRFYKKVITDTQTTILDQRMANFDGGNYLGGFIGIDWLVNKKNTIGFRANLDGGVGFEKNIGTNSISNNDLGFTKLRFDSYNNNPWNYTDLNFNAEHLLDTLGSKLLLSANYNPNFDLYSGTFDNWFLDENDNAAIQPLFYVNSNVIKNNILSSKLDLIKKTRSAITFESGIKGNRSYLTSNYDLHNKNNATGDYILDTSFTNSFTYKEEILAGYLNLTKEWDGFSLQGGVRAENTGIIAGNRSGIGYTRNYFNLFPAVNLQYNKNEDHDFQLSYNRRIDRPNYNSFNPFKNRISVFMSNKGNPNLLPEYSNTFEFSHTFRGVLSNSFSYSRIDHFMIDLTLQNDSSKETTAYVDNLALGNRFAYSVFYNQSLKKWWTITFNGAASYLTTYGKLIGQDYRSNGYFYMASLTNEFLIAKAKLEVNARYIGPRFNGVWMNGPRWGIFLAVKKSFLKEKLSVVLKVDDLFFTMVGSNRIKVQNQDWSIVATNDSRRFDISISYNFGKVKVQEREITSNEEEKGRLGR